MVADITECSISATLSLSRGRQRRESVTHVSLNEYIYNSPDELRSDFFITEVNMWKFRRNSPEGKGPG